MRNGFSATCGSRLAVAFGILGILTVPALSASVTPEDAVRHVGESATVCGTVASAKFAASSRSQPTFLDMGKPYPNSAFTVVIFGDNRPKFGTPETTLRGKRVCVTGQIRDYRGKPEIILSDPSRLTE